MLSIARICSSPPQVAYYAGLGREQYYVGDQESPAVWWGRGARMLGLTGTGSAEQLRHLLLGVSPDGKRNLVQNARKENRRAGFDLNLSPPKSVDCLFSQLDSAGRKRVLAICERVLHKTLHIVESMCGRSRRGHGGIISEEAGLVAVVCRHETSRAVPGHAPDPNLHWHVVVCNVVVRRDGTTSALDSNKLYEQNMKMCIGALYRAELSKALEQSGFSSHRPKRSNGNPASWFELDCIPKELSAEFSKRRREVEKWLRTHGASGAKASEAAVLATRRAKRDFPRDALLEAWQNTGRAFGVTPETIRERKRTPPPRNLASEAKAAVARAICRITDDRAHFSKTELLRFAAEESQCRGVGSSEIRMEVESALIRSAEIVQLQEDARSVVQYTTPEMVALEGDLLDAVRKSRSRSHHRVAPSVVACTLRAFPTIKAEQAEAVRHITTGSGSIAAVQGWAGAGKTFAMAAACQAWQAAGLEVMGTALAAKAAKTLERDAGIPSTHIDRLLWELGSGRRTLHEKVVLVLDEAGLVGTKKLHQLVRAVVTSAAAKLVLVGDSRQLTPIQAGNPFKAIIDRLGCAELEQITRQRDRWARKAVVDFAMGRADEALAEFARRGLVSIGSDCDEACQQLVSDWARDPTPISEKIILAGTRAETATLNRLCQHVRSSQGELRDTALAVGRFDLHVGDRVVFRKNNAALLVTNGSTGTITHVGGNDSVLRVLLDDGFEVAIDTAVYDKLELSYAQTTHSAQGQTKEAAYVLAGSMTHRELTYVQASRARNQTRIYTDVLSGGESLAALAVPMSRSHAKAMAHDFLQQDRL